MAVSVISAVRTARLAVLAYCLGPGLGTLALQIILPARRHDVRVRAVRQRHRGGRDLGRGRAQGARVLGPVDLLLRQVLQQAAQLRQLL